MSVQSGSDALEPMSDAAHHGAGSARGTSLLPADLTPDQLASAPLNASLDSLLIDGLTDDEDDAFAAALDASVSSPTPGSSALR